MQPISAPDPAAFCTVTAGAMMLKHFELEKAILAYCRFRHCMNGKGLEDLRVLQHRDALHRALGVDTLDDLYLLLVDADMTFLSPVHPHVLFDLIDHRFVPRLHGVWGRRAEGDITMESNFRAAPPVADFMDQPPWILRAADFPRLRERMSQVVFSNIHRFFIGNRMTQLWPGCDGNHLDEEAGLELARRDRHGLLRFYTKGPAKPSAAFFEPQRLQVRLPFSDMEIAWIEGNGTDRDMVFENFTWPIAMGMVWRCAHPFQRFSHHDRSAAHINLLFNNLFWLQTSELSVEASSTRKPAYRFLLRRIAFSPDTEPLQRGLEAFHPAAPSTPSAPSDGIGSTLLHSFPLSRFHLEVLRRHDLSTVDGTTKVLKDMAQTATGADDQPLSCMDHPQGFKVMKHWNSIKRARKEALKQKISEELLPMPRTSFGVANICLYLKTMMNLRTAPFDREILDLCAGKAGWKFCQETEVGKEDLPKCPSSDAFDPAAAWETWYDRNPYLGLPCRLPYKVSEEIEADRKYLSLGILETPHDSHHDAAFAQVSILSREPLDEWHFQMQLNYQQVSLATCEIFDLTQVLKCHLQQLQILETHGDAWSHWFNST
eukprot:s427_g14.t1